MEADPQAQAALPNWQQSLLGTLRKNGVNRQDVQSTAHLLILQSLIGCVLFIGFPLSLNLRGPMSDRLIFLAVWSAFSVLIWFTVLMPLRRKYRRANAQNAEQELMRQGARQPILYLRSFQFDKATIRNRWTLDDLIGAMALPRTVLQTREQEIVETLRGYGPVIAIGRPGEDLPPLGAARLYVAQDQWKKTVSEIADRSWSAPLE